MVRVTLMDGSLREIRREEVQGMIPALGILRHPLLGSDGLFCHHGKLVPVAGPFPKSQENHPESTWILLLGDRAQLIQGLPRFDDDKTLQLGKPALAAPLTAAAKPPEEEKAPVLDEEEARLLQEMEELLKSA